MNNEQSEMEQVFKLIKERVLSQFLKTDIEKEQFEDYFLLLTVMY